MCIGAGVLIGSRSSFLTNPASICGTMMAEFVSCAMPVNGAFRSALSNATVDERRSYGLGCHSISWTITIAMNCGQFEQYPIHKRSFTAPSYSFPARITRAVFQQDNARPHAAKTVKSYLDSLQVQLFLGLRFRRICHRLNMCGISLGAFRS
ncbi:hypothetical protein TNCV_379891 [Trichonephila clavipes]|nr:hypothetical protein TNCV_379891 [Trichonephila clavipes]